MTVVCRLLAHEFETVETTRAIVDGTLMAREIQQCRRCGAEATKDTALDPGDGRAQSIRRIED